MDVEDRRLNERIWEAEEEPGCCSLLKNILIAFKSAYKGGPESFCSQYKHYEGRY